MEVANAVLILDAKYDEPTTPEPKTRKCCRNGPGAWCKKYFWEGQDLSKDRKKAAENIQGLPWYKVPLIKHRRIIAFAIPALLYHFFWWAIMIKRNLWYLFLQKYPMTITMVFGGIVGGMTSEGGGAIAFPVMTLALKVDPSVARDFSMMIQSSGMSAATFAILFMGVRVEWHALIFNTLGAVVGVVLGFYTVDPYLSPQLKKLGFVSIWFAFASVLIFLNRMHKRKTFKKIQNFNLWKMLVLLFTGFIGGICTSFAGTGLDICSFMILTLLFRISEKVTTPTTVILMTFNSLVGILWRGVIFQDVTQEAWEFLAVTFPLVVIGAPIGSVLGTHFHRLVLASFVIFLDTVALIAGFVIVRPLTLTLVGICVGLIIGCLILFIIFTQIGQRLLNNVEKKERQEHDKIVNQVHQENGAITVPLLDPVRDGYSVVVESTEQYNSFNADLSTEAKSLTSSPSSQMTKL